ncbi:hypothetical protein LN042_24115 [Kitasatospora sp. RB6PN24]|uniref:hypothetical protein n=1 Tax=Kitasatospora humi TaxID=2893891 RepID=UPI001E49EDE5|nr:hypothetical protein [Kitasatospora humi]MCC9310115.1 hypothetical protein [Kitasatospora humi]
MTTNTRPTPLQRALLSALNHVLEPAAAVTAGAAAGVAVYRTLATRPIEIRVASALAAAGLACSTTAQLGAAGRTALLRRSEPDTYLPAGPEAELTPSLQRIAADTELHAAEQAALAAQRLDRGHGTLTYAENWVGTTDGPATCDLEPGVQLRYTPSGASTGITAHRGMPEYFELLIDGTPRTTITSITQLHDHLRRHADGRPLEDADPWSTGAQ